MRSSELGQMCLYLELKKKRILVHNPMKIEMQLISNFGKAKRRTRPKATERRQCGSYVDPRIFGETNH